MGVGIALPESVFLSPSEHRPRGGRGSLGWRPDQPIQSCGVSSCKVRDRVDPRPLRPKGTDGHKKCRGRLGRQTRPCTPGSVCVRSSLVGGYNVKGSSLEVGPNVR